MAVGRQAHWDAVFAGRDEDRVSWFQATPEPSLELIARTGAGMAAAIVDVGGGASRLVDALVARGYRDVTVLDLAPAALAAARARLGAGAERVRWVVADITAWEPARRHDLWHDRAAFHFLTEAADRAAYLARLRRGLAEGGHAIIGTFAPDGPERCSGLPVMRYDAEGLARELGAGFTLIESRRHAHLTPAGMVQQFQFSLFRRATAGHPA